MNHSQTKDIIKNIAKQEGLTIADIKEVMEAAPGFVTEIMRNSSREDYIFPSVRVLDLGLFYCPGWKIEQFKKVNEEE